MTKQIMADTNWKSQIKLLESKDGTIRKKARESLVAMGGRPAVPALNRMLLHSPSKQVRWEAAKALYAIKDTRAIPSLVQALEDKNSDVAWIAAEALGLFQQAAWPDLLHALMNEDSDSALLRQGAHHVLANQKHEEFDDLLAILMDALEHGAVHEALTGAAFEIFKRMKAT